MKPKEFWKKIRFSKEGFGKISTASRSTSSPLKRIKVAFESGDYERWLVKNEEKEAVKHFGTELQKELDREILEAVQKEYDRKKFKEVLEEISTKTGEDK